MGLSGQFIDEIKGLLPHDEADELIKALSDSEPSVSVRVNSGKSKNCHTSGIVPWCDKGFYLDERPQFTFDPLLHAGCYYVQDASSMFLAHALNMLISDSEPVRYLDLCAAPGGKTTAAIDTLPEDSLVVANEIMSGRSQILKENIIKWGNPNCIVTNNDSAAFSKLTHFFDIIAADVPCSGEGMMRKDDEAVAQWSPVLVAECADRQREIVTNAWQALRPGGFLIYSTCTFNRQENEDIVEYIVNELCGESIEIKTSPEWNIHPAIDSPIHGYHFFPHRTRGEGLFLSAIRKPDDEVCHKLKAPNKKKGKKEKPQQVPATLKGWVAGGMAMTMNGDTVNAFPASYTDELALLQEHLKIIYYGCEVATVKGRDLIPAHSLAVSTCRAAGTFPECDVDYATAIAYLRGETVTIDAPRGCVLLTYADSPIGFVKNLGNRANNLYPKEWRIKSTHIPAAPPHIL